MCSALWKRGLTSVVHANVLVQKDTHVIGVYADVAMRSTASITFVQGVPVPRVSEVRARRARHRVAGQEEGP